jgi:hypothetical protein
MSASGECDGFGFGQSERLQFGERRGTGLLVGGRFGVGQVVLLDDVAVRE